LAGQTRPLAEATQVPETQVSQGPQVAEQQWPSELQIPL
jgi:hypothetical protein